MLLGEKVEPEFLRPSVRCLNPMGQLEYFLSRGAKQEDILRDTGLTYDYLKEENHWINYRISNILMKNCQDSIPSITAYDWQTAGQEVARINQTRVFKLIISISGIQSMYRKSVNLISSLVTYATMEILDLRNGFCDFTIRFSENFRDVSLGHAGFWIAGVFSSFPTAMGLNPAVVKVLYHQSYLTNLIEIFYDKLDLRCSEEENSFLINGVPFGEQVELQCQSDLKVFSIDYERNSPKANAVVLTSDLEMDGIIYLKKGEIFNAPYFRMQAQWEPEPPLHRRVKYLFSTKQDVLEAVSTELEKQVSNSQNHLSTRINSEEESQGHLDKQQGQVETLETMGNQETEGAKHNFPGSWPQKLLTPREIEILNWVREGKTSWEIGRIIGISKSTVNFHMNNIIGKLKAKNRTMAVAEAISRGLLKP